MLACPSLMKHLSKLGEVVLLAVFVFGSSGCCSLQSGEKWVGKLKKVTEGNDADVLNKEELLEALGDDPSIRGSTPYLSKGEIRISLGRCFSLCLQPYIEGMDQVSSIDDILNLPGRGCESEKIQSLSLYRGSGLILRYETPAYARRVAHIRSLDFLPLQESK